MPNESFSCPTGLVVVTSPGAIRVETAFCLLEAARASDQAGLKATYRNIGGALADKARNDACRMMLNEKHGWVLFIDGDMVFPPHAIVQMLQTAYQTHPWADIVGGYCNLRGGVHIPTIDTGTGTWESWYPGSDVVEVIRTGGAFLLLKAHVCQRVPDPWFTVRSPQRWLDAMHELDNFARTKWDGKNPFLNLPGLPWEKLLDIAARDPQSARSSSGYEVGEDSGFCDRAKAAGLRIVVNTNIEIGHLDTVTISGLSHRDKMREREREVYRMHGLL